MVVVDKKMADFHGDELNEYVLTLMSIVAMIFKDASIGNPITLAVVKMHVLEDMDFAKRSAKSGAGVAASDMLEKFCAWQHTKSDNNDASPNHHDSALLLTREKICRDPVHDECETLGLAELGTMCDKFTSCSLVKDIGLNSAFTIAHELGHVLNMPHDDDIKCKEYLGSNDVHLVMSRMLDHNTYPWSWSNCSRHFLTEFLDAGYGYCLQDRPSMDILNDREDKEKLPGEGFTEDKQCELIYDKGSKICPYMPKCAKLWCTNSPGQPEGCRTRQLPSADGTPCHAEGNYATHWCQKGHCVPKDRGLLRPVDGGWGPWQNYGECSRSCGGGVKKAARLCDSPPPANGGRYCVGKRVKYKSCSTRECPSTAIDFREQQCAQFNNNNFDIHGLSENVTWVPKYGNIVPGDRCKLYCRVAHSTAYYLLKDKVVDGTLCGPDTFDICVNGICLPAGCDHVFNSTVELDFCGVCGGNNSTCQQVIGTYDEAKSGYSRVVVIPSGSTNLDIRQHGFTGTNNDHNYLALVDSETKNYILNGRYVVSTYHKLIFYSGTPLEYTGSNAVVERINSSRPLTKDLIVEVLSVGDLYPPNILYQYTVRNNSYYRYEWLMTNNWSPCDKICQGKSKFQSTNLKLAEF
ncbi:hypothetical protein AAG570_011859 [Ranatra chinensis]|uniref:Peptidase M12B domain-containing protein n=1 Tax=Ranatra chinensis TaxID=642074 RepID=A0ABD0YTK3_9HEMI